LLIFKGGNPVLYHAELPDFRIKIIKIIKSLSSKNFSVLREKVLGVIKDLRADNKRKMEDNVFGKHYWSVFKKDPENAEIKDLWTALPRSNAAKKGKAPQRVASLSSDDGQSTMPSTPNTLMLPDEEVDNENVKLFREINHDADYQKRGFGDLDNGTFPWDF